MSGTPHRYGPSFISNSVANIYTPPASTIYQVIRHIHIANKTGTAATFTLYIGATGGSASGTELFKDVSVAANGYVEYYPDHNMMSTDFLTGVSGTASALVIVVDTEQMVVPAT